MYIILDRPLPAGLVFTVDVRRFPLSDAGTAHYAYGAVSFWDEAGYTWWEGRRVELALHRDGCCLLEDRTGGGGAEIP